MLLQLIEMTDQPDNWYAVMLDGQQVSCRSGNFEDAQQLYNNIVANPNYLTDRQKLLQEQII